MAELQNTITRTRSHSRMHPAPNLGARRVRKIGVAVGAVLALGACSGESDAASVPTIHLEPTTSTTAAPTTTTTEATTTTEDPAVAYERDVAEITAVYESSLAYLSTHGVMVDYDVMASISSGPLLDLKIRNLNSWAGQGFVVAEDAEYDFQMLDVTVEMDTASSTSCNFDGVAILTATGQVVLPPDTSRFLRSVGYRRIDGEWRIVRSEYAHGEPTECEV